MPRSKSKLRPRKQAATPTRRSKASAGQIVGGPYRDPYLEQKRREDQKNRIDEVRRNVAKAKEIQEQKRQGTYEPDPNAPPPRIVPRSESAHDNKLKNAPTMEKRPAPSRRFREGINERMPVMRRKM